MNGRLALVVPCFNEAERLRPEDFRRFIDEHPDVDLVFVDDGSTDSTRTVLDQLERSRPVRIFVVPLEENVGKGEAVRAGVQYALRRGDAEFVGYWDADLAAPLDQTEVLLARFGDIDHVVGVLGVRRPGLGHRIQRTLLRRLLGAVYAKLGALSLGVPLADVQCGAKLFRLTPIVVDCFVAPFLSTWAFDVELLMRLDERLGGELDSRVVEVPLREWRDVPNSQLKPTQRLRAVVELARLTRVRGSARFGHDGSAG